jgi:hypothetical protein
MAFQISPGVSVTEVDLTTVVPAVSTTNGAFAGQFVWGPADKRVLVDSEVRLVNTFGKPDTNTYVSFFTAANFLAYGNNLKVVRSVGANANNATSGGTGIQIKNEDVWQNTYSTGQGSVGVWAARYPGSLGNSVTVSICPSANAWSQNLTATQSITANVVNGSALVTMSANAYGYIATGDTLTVGAYGDVEVTAVAANGLLVTVNTSALYTSTSNANPVTRTWGWAEYFDGAPGTSDYAASVNGSRDEMHVIVIDEGGKFSTGVGGANTVLEVYPYLSKASDARTGDGSTNYYRDVIFNKSNYVYWMDHLTAGTNWGNAAAGITFTDTQVNSYTPLSGGLTDAATTATLETSYDLFANPDEVDVSLLLGGDANATVGSYLIDNIAKVRKDCVVFLSPRQTDVVDQIGNEVDNITNFRNLLTSSTYAVLDSGWKYMFDKYNNLYRYVPLNADIAGTCVRTDTQNDPWWSPAGLNRGRIKNVIKLAWNPTQAERDDLYKIAVNPVVAFPGEGVILFGDKTLQSKPSAFDRINVRRLFIVLEKAIATASKYSLFEFNDEFTRAQFVNLVEPFLRDVQGRRGIYDFRVVCDETNNTPEVIDRNEFIGDIYVRPARSINYIQLNFVAVRTGVDFNEIVGRVSNVLVE